MPYLTTGEAARKLGVGLNTIKRWISSGDLRGIRTPGGHWRIPRKELNDFIRFRGLPDPELTTGVIPRILVVDDDPGVCALIEAVLSEADFESDVQSVPDGYTGLMRIGAWRPDILILDILMPGINGLEVLRRIKAGPDSRDMAILVITSAFDLSAITQVVDDSGVCDLLPKPLDSRRLLAAVVTCLDGMVMAKPASLPG